MTRPTVLFLCTGNACRSQMAEGWLRHLAGDAVVALSAGTAPAGLDARAVAAMAEVGVDVSGQTSDALERYLDDPPELVIAVCDRAAAACPTLPGATAVLRWPFPDPAAARGTDGEVRAAFGEVRDAIRGRLEAWLAEGAPPRAEMPHCRDGTMVISSLSSSRISSGPRFSESVVKSLMSQKRIETSAARPPSASSPGLRSTASATASET